MTIRLLEDRVINQIAAGEVVERPASVVKELVENSLDSGAKTIDVRLRDGGRQLIRISDNGCGMNKQDALMCIERHATSKLVDAADLLRVVTLGFRGEAIPSIASISDFELVTRTVEDEFGTRVHIKTGKLVDVSQAGCAQGTDIAVRDIFQDLPARQKFLRTRSTELSHCVEAVIRAAMLRTDVSFSVTHQGRELLRVPVDQPWGERVADLVNDMGRSPLLTLDVENEGLRLRALLGPMSSHKSSATGAMYLYVNGRYVRDPVIRKAVAQAYKDRLPRGRYPFAIIRFDLPPDQVDVNVHPSKTEVRFMNPGRVMTFVTEALEAELGAVAHSSQPYESQGHAFSSPDSKLPFGLDFSQPRRFSRSSGEAYVPSLPAHPDDDGGLEPRTEESVEARMTAPGDDDLSVAAPTPSPWGQESPELTGLEHEKQVLGVVWDRYAIVEFEDDVLILDLFVARQGLALYELEHYRARFLGETRPVLVPVSVNIPVVGDDLFNGVADILERFGFDIAMASPGLGVVKRIPQIALGCDLESWVETMFGSCLDCSPESREDAVLKQLATLWSHQETPLDSYEVRSILANAREAGIELIDKSLGIAISRADMASAINRGGL